MDVAMMAGGPSPMVGTAPSTTAAWTTAAACSASVAEG
jgi:hypothetical protein